MEVNNRILIVDDNVAIHDDFRKILCPTRTVEISKEYSHLESALFEDEEVLKPKTVNIRYNMDFAFQAEEGLQMILDAEKDGHPYAIVFTDVRMPPGFDGVQLVGEILENIPQIEIVIVTAFSDYTWEDMSAKFGWTDRLLFLRKPFDVITVRQIAMTLTKKWTLGAEARELAKQRELNLNQLEKLVTKRTARLAQANKDLQSFTYIVSHDLSSPLLSIQGFLGELNLSLNDAWPIVEKTLEHLCKEEEALVREAFEEHIPEAMDFIKTSAAKMDGLIKSILRLSRVGYREFVLECIDMNELVEANVKALAYAIEKEHISINIADLPEVYTDRLSMEQIVGNLLSNALKFLDPTRPGRIDVVGEVREDDTVYRITDNGCGIAEQDLPRIFEIFMRGGRAELPGEGLGLAFVKTLVGQLGGTISCESCVDKGTTFVFNVPHHLPQDQNTEHLVS